MNFVTKKEYENAVEVLERALKNGQMSHILHYKDDNLEMGVILLAESRFSSDIFQLNQISFLSPEQAAKNRLSEIRKELKKQQEDTENNQKALERLEKEEQKLAKLLPTLKE